MKKKLTAICMFLCGLSQVSMAQYPFSVTDTNRLMKLSAASTDVNAVNDSFSVLQASRDTFYVTANDTIVPAGDSACISIISGGAHFSALDCGHIIYQPDSFFTGFDTCRYALCDTSGICDTATVIVHVFSNPALLPVAGFVQETVLPGYQEGNFVWNSYGTLFQHTPGCYVGACNTYPIINTSLRYDSVHWQILAISPTGCHSSDSILYYQSDTISFSMNGGPGNHWGCGNTPKILVCLTAYNRYGSTTFCDTSCHFTACEGINEVPFASFDLYPNPFSGQLTVSINASTAAQINISISDGLGREVYPTREQQISGGKQNITLPLSYLPDGMYIWNIETKSESTTIPYRFHGKIVKQ
jgi:hypothetical protein